MRNLGPLDSPNSLHILWFWGVWACFQDPRQYFSLPPGMSAGNNTVTSLLVPEQLITKETGNSTWDKHFWIQLVTMPGGAEGETPLWQREVPAILRIPAPDVYFFPAQALGITNGKVPKRSLALETVISKGWKPPGWMCQLPKQCKLIHSCCLNSRVILCAVGYKKVTSRITRGFFSCLARINSSTHCRISQMTSEPLEAMEVKALHKPSASLDFFLPVGIQGQLLPTRILQHEHTQWLLVSRNRLQGTLAFPGILLCAGGSVFFERWHRADRLPWFSCCLFSHNLVVCSELSTDSAVEVDGSHPTCLLCCLQEKCVFWVRAGLASFLS